MPSRFRLCAAAAAALVLALGAHLPASAEPGDIKGQDVTGDKSRSANDGWSQAPVPREESAGKDAPDPGGQSTSDKPGSANAGDKKQGGSLDNGADDPQKPLDQRAPGPSGKNPASPSK